MGRWKMGSHLFPGTVTAVEGDRIHIAFDDGDRNGPGLPPWRCRVSLMARMCGGPRKCPLEPGIGAESPVGMILLFIFLRAVAGEPREFCPDDIDPFRRKLHNKDHYNNSVSHPRKDFRDAFCPLPPIDLFYADKGSGDPVLFSNGLSGDHLYWNAQLRAFSKKFRALAPDNRDVGQTRHPGQAYTSPTCATTPPACCASDLPRATSSACRWRHMIAAGIGPASPSAFAAWCVDTLATRQLVLRHPDTFEKIAGRWRTRRRSSTPSCLGGLSWRFF